EEVDRDACLGDLESGHQTGEPAADDDDARRTHVRNAIRIASAVPYIATNSSIAALRATRCARWPTVIPHVMANVQRPFVKWNTEARTPTRNSVKRTGSATIRCMKSKVMSAP